MIDIASYVTNGIKIPGQKATHVESMQIFKNYLTQLKKQLNVSIILLKLCLLGAYMHQA